MIGVTQHRHQSGTVLSQETNQLHLVPMCFMRSILLQFSNSRWWPRSTSRTTGRRLEKLLLFVPLSVTEKERNQSCTSVDAFHKKSPLAPARNAKGVPGRGFPRMRLRTPRTALSRRPEWPGLKGSKEEGTDLPGGDG
jgi:hypothetical protein